MRMSDWIADVCSSDLRSYKNGDAPLRNSLARIEIPDKWDRSGLPAWTYFNKELLDLETEVLFRRHWQLACHQSDLPEPGSYVTFDMCGERALIIRGEDGAVRAFQNVCRHRGPRAAVNAQGRPDERRGRPEGVSTCRSRCAQYHKNKTNKRES